MRRIGCLVKPFLGKSVTEKCAKGTGEGHLEFLITYSVGLGKKVGQRATFSLLISEARPWQQAVFKEWVCD